MKSNFFSKYGLVVILAFSAIAPLFHWFGTRCLSTSSRSRCRWPPSSFDGCPFSLLSDIHRSGSSSASRGRSIWTSCPGTNVTISPFLYSWDLCPTCFLPFLTSSGYWRSSPSPPCDHQWADTSSFNPPFLCDGTLRLRILWSLVTDPLN